MSFANLIPTLSQKIVQHSPAILTAIGVAGVAATAVLSARAAVEAHEILLTEADRYENDFTVEDFTLKEKVLLTWRAFLPPLFVGSATIVCVISAQSINSRRNAALLSLYTISDRMLTEFREKAREIHGDKKVAEIYDEIAADSIRNHEPEDFMMRQIMVRGDGVGLCRDMYSDRYFVSSQTEVDAAVNATNAEMNMEGDVSLNFFYDQIGLGRIPVGDEVGWSQSTGLMTVQYTYVPSEDGSPCMAVTFKRQPEHGFHRIFR